MSARPYGVVRPLAWSERDGAILLDDPSGGPPVRLAASSRALLEGVAREEAFAALARLLPEDGSAADAREARARRFVAGLHRLGYVRVPVEPPAWTGGYRIERELGRGAVGVAWLARAPDGTPVVVKAAWGFHTPPDVAEDALRREAATLSELRVPGLVRLVDALERDGRFLLVRELVDGDDLGSHHRRPLPAREARATAAEVAAIAAHVHARGFVLQDLRPSNFFRRRGDGAIVLADVGHARAASAPPLRPGTVEGGLGFLAPECLRGEAATAASDVWGVGALLLFLSTGLQPPRDGRIERLLAGADPEVRGVAAPLVARAPQDRPTAEAARAMLAP